MIRRREFIAGVGAAAWPVVARAQQGDPVRRIGVLSTRGEDDQDGKPSAGPHRHSASAIACAPRYPFPWNPDRVSLP
jgi:hypothetical protein